MVDWVKLDQAIASLFQGCEAANRVSVLRGLEASGVKGLQVMTKELLRALDREAFDDLFAEAQVAAVFLRNGFRVTFLKPPKPDLRVEADDYLLFVEVKRIREDYEEAEEIEKKMRQAANKLVEYGDVNRGIDKILSCIQDALSQLVPGEINLVFLWAQRSSWEEWEFLLAMDDIEKEIYRDHQRYASLSGLIYRSRWIRLTNRRQFYFWKHPAGTTLDEGLTRRLENLT